MKIVADRAIPFLQPCFGDLGPAQTVDGRGIDRALARDADLLIVRTVTRIDAALLDGSRVRFVASPTAGVDHVDLEYLRAAGIGFAHAPGCNARAVAEYVLSALFALGLHGRDGLRVGIVGRGEVGSRLGAFLDALGIAHLDCDPPLREAGHAGPWHGLPDLAGADVISLHVPLTGSGPHATRGLIGAGFLSKLRDDALLINTARGGVIDEAALLEFLGRNPRADCVLDVWDGEPDIRVELVRRAAIGTPHVAGYSLDARLRATLTVSRATRAYFRVADIPAEPPLPAPEAALLQVDPGLPDRESVARAVLGSHDVRADAQRLRALPGMKAAERPAFFADLRNNYPVRREFPARTLRLPAGRARLRAQLDALGFRTTTQD